MAKDSEQRSEDLKEPEQARQADETTTRQTLRRGLRRHKDTPQKTTRIGTRFQTRSDIRRVLTSVLSILLAAAVVLAAVFLVIYRDQISLDRARRWLSNLNSRSSGSVTESFTFESHRSNVFGLAGSSLAVGSVSGLTVFDAAGSAQAVIQQSISDPCLKTGDAAVLLADLGHRAVCAANLSLGEEFTLELDNTIYGADMAREGWFCVLTAADGCKAMVRVYNDTADEVFQWKSSSYYLTLAALSDNGDYLATAALGAGNASIQSLIQILDTSSTGGPVQVDLGSENVLALDWMDDVLIVFGETQLAVIQPDGSISGRFGYDSRSLTAAAVSGGYAVAAFDAGTGGGQCLLTTISKTGELIAQAYLDGPAQSLSAQGNYLSVLTGSSLTIFSRDLNAQGYWTGLTGTGTVLTRTDGSALLAVSGRATLYR